MSKSKLTKKEHYQYLINARNFHYDNFNKWMTYFYVAIGALFIGYYTIAKEKGLEDEKIILLLLGYISSLFWYWSSKGYYFWAINFITLINNCEKKSLKLKKKKRVYFVFANRKKNNNYFNPLKGANISTSKVAILFAFMISIAWGTMLSNKLVDLEFYFDISISAIVTLISSYLIPKYFLKSKIKHLANFKIRSN